MSDVHSHLTTWPAAERPELLAPAVAAALTYVLGARVFEIDPALADTAAMCAAYDVPLDTSANCVLVTGRRGGDERHVACVALATTRVDVNTFVRKRLDVRKASFSAMEFAVSASGMEYGGITPIGLPAGWPVWIDAAVAATAEVIVGSGIRGSKILLPGADLALLPGAEVLEGLAVPVLR
nr:YbaK/EbsC family protein [Propionicicella superfundia]